MQRLELGLTECTIPMLLYVLWNTRVEADWYYDAYYRIYLKGTTGSSFYIAGFVFVYPCIIHPRFCKNTYKLLVEQILKHSHYKHQCISITVNTPFLCLTFKVNTLRL